jgi:hypothetical protein
MLADCNAVTRDPRKPFLLLVINGRTPLLAIICVSTELGKGFTNQTAEIFVDTYSACN